MFPDFIDSANVGMIESRRGSGFAPKALQHLRVARSVVGQELQGHESAKLGVLSLINDTHPATAELLENAVVRDGLPNHWDEILGLEGGQVNEGTEVGRVPKVQLKLNPYYTHHPILDK